MYRMHANSRGRTKVVRQISPNATISKQIAFIGVVALGCCCVISCNILPKVIIPDNLYNPKEVVDKNGFRDDYSICIDRKKVIQFNALGSLKFILSDTPPRKIDIIIEKNREWEFIFVVSMSLEDSLKLQAVLSHHNCDFPVVVDSDNVFAKKNRLGKLTAVGWICDEKNHVYGNGCIGTEKSFFDQVRIFRYAQIGQYLNSIGEKGRGLGEYLNIDSVQLLGDTLAVFSMPNATIHYYLLDGSYIGNKAVMQEGFQYTCVKEGALSYIVYGASSPYRLVLTERDGEAYSYLKHSSKIISFMDNVPVFSFYKDTAFLREPFGRTIYKYSDKKLLSENTFDLGKNGLRDVFFDLDYEHFAEFLMTQNYRMISNYLQSDPQRFVEVFFPQKHRYDYGLSNGEGWSWFSFGDNVKDPFTHSFKNLQDRVLYCLINPFYLENMDADIRVKADNPNQIASIQEEDNYVVAKIILK